MTRYRKFKIGSCFIIGILSLVIPSAAFATSQNFSSNSKRSELAPLAAPAQNIVLGEHLTYDVFWMGVPVGVGELWVKEKIMSIETYKLIGEEIKMLLAGKRGLKLKNGKVEILDFSK